MMPDGEIRAGGIERPPANGPRLVESFPVEPCPAESRTVESTILLVEDEAFVRDVTREVLQAAGYRVLTASNATEAMSVYENVDRIDLLITDVVLPGETGLTLAARLHRENSRLVVLFVTGYMERMSSWDGVENCLAKPYSSETLVRTVRGLLPAKNSGESVFSRLPAGASGLHDLCGNL